MDPAETEAANRQTTNAQTADEPEAALARADEIVRRAPTVAALLTQHHLRWQLCWMVGALEPLDRRLELLKQQGAQWQEDARALAGHYARQLDADRALVLLDEVSPPGPRRWIDRIAILISCLRFQEARRCAAEALDKGSFDALQALALARTCLQAGDASLATRFAQAAVERAPEDAGCLALEGTMRLWSGDLAGAAARATRILSLSPEAAAGEKLAGQVALLRGDARSALGRFERAASRQPEMETWVLLAETHRVLGQRREARIALASAHTGDGTYSFAREANELMLLSSGSWLRWLARPALDRIGWLNRPELHGALSALGLAPRPGLPRSRARSSWPSLARALNEALDLLSGNRTAVLTRKTRTGAFECVQPGPSIRGACMRVRAALASGGFEAAIAAHEALLEEYGHSPLVYTHRGELLLWWGRYDEATEDFAAALRLHRATRWAWAGLGACHLLRGKPALALATFGLGRLHVIPAITTRPYAAGAWHALGRYRRARAELRTAEAMHPSRPSTSLGLVLEEACLGRARAVEEHLGHLQAAVPGFVRAVLRDTGTSVEDLRRNPRWARDVAERGFEMMRGNRSSGTLTWFDASGRAYLETVRSPG